MSLDDEVTEGWEWPMYARKAHFFKKKKSLCGKWIYRGDPIPEDRWGPPDPKEECAKCRRKLDGD